jgi:hypothetical protein
MTEQEKRDTAWWKRTIGPKASGIFRTRTLVGLRPSAQPREPKLFRPSLTFNLGLLLLGVSLVAVAAVHRRHLDARFDALVLQRRALPFEVQRIRQDLSALELDEEALRSELRSRLAAVDAQRTSEFHLVLDRKAKKLIFRFGDRVVREAALETRAPRPVLSASGDRLSPPPLSGAFTIREKLEAPSWKPPPWVWKQAGRRVPAPLPEIRGGLGRYVISLTEEVVLHSPPPPESPLRGAMPGSFMAPEADLAAIWKRIGRETRVYVF